MSSHKVFSESQIKSVEDVWHPTKNLPLKIENISLGSARKVWFQCAKGHEWDAPVNSRTSIRVIGCPYCANKRILQGFNDLTTICPELVAEWHPTKNEGFSPNSVTKGSHIKVWWKGKNCGHEWVAQIRGRYRSISKGCPVCLGQEVLNGFNDLVTTNPSVAAEWHPILNGEFKPTQVTKSSNKKVWWVCAEGHEWESVINNRNRVSGGGCPYCSNFFTQEGFNDLASTHPQLTKEWNYVKQSLLPTEVTRGSDLKVWWVCAEGHEWETNVYNRTSKNPRGCPKCSNNSTSKDEKNILEYIQKTLKFKAINNTKKVIPPYELDIYIPERNIAIEFNGLYWHSERTKPQNYHYDKWLACKEVGIQLIQIWEDDWNRNPELVKRILRHKLSVSSGEKEYIKTSLVSSPTEKQVNLFLEENHIEGVMDGSVRVGLKNSFNELIAVMVFEVESNIEGKTLNLICYAASHQKVAGFTKLLKEVEERYADLKKVIILSDNTLGDDKLYEKSGFTVNGKLEPDYKYIQNRVRYNKSDYHLKRFRTDPNLQYMEGLTESQLAKLNGLERIWDAGRTVWEKTYG